MSLVTQISTALTRVGTEFKSIRTLIGGSGTATISALATTDKTSLVAAINEVMTTAGASTLDGLTDVVVTTPATGHVLRNNGTNFVNVLGTTYFEAAGAAATAQAAAIAASQPLDADLTSIAAVTTTSYGRAFLALSNQAGLVALIPTSSETVTGLVETATEVEAVAGTDTTRAVTSAGVAAAIANLVDSAPGTLNTLNELAAALGDDPDFATTITTSLSNKQPLDTDLTAIAALTSAADKVAYATGAGTWGLTTFTSAGRALVDDADAAAQRTTLSVYSTTEMGDPTTDFSAVFVAALA